MEKTNYLDYRFEPYQNKGVRFKLEGKKSDKWEQVDDDIVRYYVLYDRLFYKKYDDKGEVWWMCELPLVKPECLGKRYFEGAFFVMHNFWVSFFTQDNVFKRIVYDNYVTIDYDKRLLCCHKDGKYDVYRIECFTGFDGSGCLVPKFGSEILHVNAGNGKMLHLRSRLNPDKSLYWQEVDITPWYARMGRYIKKMCQRRRKALV